MYFSVNQTHPKCNQLLRYRVHDQHTYLTDHPQISPCSLLHPAVLQNDAQQNDRPEGHGERRLGVLQLAPLDQGERPERARADVLRRRGLSRPHVAARAQGQRGQRARDQRQQGRVHRHGDTVALRIARPGANERLPRGLQRPGAPDPGQDLRRARARAAHVRHPEHRRQGLEAQYPVQGGLSRQSHNGPVVLAGRAVVQQRDASEAAAVCHGHVEGADERVQGALREQRAPAVHHREVGHAGELPEGSHLVSCFFFLLDLFVVGFEGVVCWSREEREFWLIF